MAEDTEVLRGIWNGGISIAFQLSADEVFIPEAPVPVYAIAPRMSYLSLAMTDRLHKYFQRFIDPESNIENAWLEDSNGNPVKWHWPVGVLYDLECLSETHLNSNVKTNWLLTVHYRNFPEGDIVKFSCREAIESFIKSGIKEADSLKHRVRITNDMHQNDFKKLFQGLATERFDLFWSVNRRLMESPGSEEHFRHIPFKIHHQSGKIIQKLFSPVDKSGQQKTLLDLFRFVFPSLIGTHSNSNEGDETALSTKFNNPEAIDSCDLDVSEETKLQFRYLIQGLSPALNTPIQWLSEHLSHPDNFLHICIAPSTDCS